MNRRRELRVALFVLGLVSAALVAFWALCVRMPGSSFAGPLPPADPALRASAERLRRDVEHLALSIGERHAGRPAALRSTVDWLERSLGEAGYDVTRRSFEVAGDRYENLEATLGAGARAGEWIVVGAHYDSALGSPGANDNGSGVAALLELARTLRGRTFGRELRFLLFANEEPPHFQTDAMGSVHAARRSRGEGERIAAMLSLETLGYYDDRSGAQRYPFPLTWFYPERGDFVAFVGNLRSAELVRRSLAVFRRHEPFPSQGGCLPEALPGVGWSDHWAYWQHGFPAFMVTDTAPFRYPHYHSPQDTPGALDHERLARVVRGLAAVVSDLAGAR